MEFAQKVIAGLTGWEVRISENENVSPQDMSCTIKLSVKADFQLANWTATVMKHFDFLTCAHATDLGQ